MFSQERVRQLEQRVQEFQGALAAFERARQQLLEKRKNSSDSMMLALDGMLRANARTLESLKSGLELTKKELREQRGGGSSPAR